jgi:hypothetical protein
MKAAVNTYHNVGPWNARRLLATCPNPVWKATAVRCFQMMFAAPLAV